MRPQVSGGARDGLAATRICRAAGAARPHRSTGAVVAAEAHAPPSAPDRVSSDASVVRDRTQGGNPGAHALVADAASADAYGARRDRGRRTAMAAAARGGRTRRTRAADDRRRL